MTCTGNNDNGARKLASQILSGDRGAFELFYRMEFNNLVHFVESYTHDLQRSEDIAQETLCTLWERRDSIDPGRNLRSFVFTIARNRTINLLREKSLFSDSSLRSGITEDILALQDTSMEEMIDSLDLQKLIDNVWNHLPSSARNSFRMSREEGMTNREIAGAQGLTVKAVEYHIKISLRMFREKLKDYITKY